MAPVYNVFGFPIPAGLTKLEDGSQPREYCPRCHGWLPDHEFAETCDWQCQGCGKMIPNGEWNLIPPPIFITVCNDCMRRWVEADSDRKRAFEFGAERERAKQLTVER